MRAVSTAESPRVGPPHGSSTVRAARPAARRHRVRGLTLVAFLGLWLGLLMHGLPYYRLPLPERLRSPAHAALRPNGELGLLYAYVGTALILLLFLYSIRKRVRALAKLGRLERWLNVHIFMGIAGPLMITLHSSFKVTGAIAIGYWAMIGVMLSGFVGYYLLRQVGGALSDTERDSGDLTGRLEALDRELVERYRLTPADLASLRRESGADRAEHMGPISSLLFFIGRDFRRFFDALGVLPRRPMERRLGRSEARSLHAMIGARVLLERRRAFLRSAAALFHYWHAIHRPFTIVLFITLGIHIGVAIWLGYALPQG
jgi:hypothetical protein